MNHQSILIAEGAFVVDDMIARIRENRDYLSEIDAATGDGDHGINMSKGFSQCAEKLAGSKDTDLIHALNVLTESLLEGIGGSMGPLYGSFFMSFAEALTGREQLDAEGFGRALRAGLASIEALGDAKVGDKTLIDTLVPAERAFSDAVAAGESFTNALERMAHAAERGKDATKQMQAKIGRAARLGERSIGTVDAGATSCFIILRSMRDSITRRISG